MTTRDAVHLERNRGREAEVGTGAGLSSSSAALPRSSCHGPCPPSAGSPFPATAAPTADGTSPLMPAGHVEGWGPAPSGGASSSGSPIALHRRGGGEGPSGQQPRSHRRGRPVLGASTGQWAPAAAPAPADGVGRAGACRGCGQGQVQGGTMVRGSKELSVTTRGSPR